MYRDRCHKQMSASGSYDKIKHFDWMFQVTWIVFSQSERFNSALGRYKIIKLVFVTLIPRFCFLLSAVQWMVLWSKMFHYRLLQCKIFRLSARLGWNLLCPSSRRWPGHLAGNRKRAGSGWSPCSDLRHRPRFRACEARDGSSPGRWPFACKSLKYLIT